jgi:hypothetical protein
MITQASHSKRRRNAFPFSLRFLSLCVTAFSFAPHGMGDLQGLGKQSTSIASQVLPHPGADPARGQESILEMAGKTFVRHAWNLWRLPSVIVLPWNLRFKDKVTENPKTMTAQHQTPT